MLAALAALAVRASPDLDTVTVASRTAAAQPARRLATKRGQKLPSSRPSRP